MAEAEGTGENKDITITLEEKEKIELAMALANSNADDRDEVIPRPFRLSGVVPCNIPIIGSLVFLPQTYASTIFMNWVNQSYDAGINYGNKNSSCPYSNSDIAKGYLAAVGSSIAVALALRISGSRFLLGAYGAKLIILNSVIHSITNSVANFFNTYFMRGAERKKGIDVFSDGALTNKIGVSKLAAK